MLIYLLNSTFIQGIEMSQIKISVAVDDAHLSQIQQISEQLQSSGMNVEKILSSIGVINGLVESNQLDSLYQIEGIQSIEPQQGFQLAPPNSNIQ